MKKGLISILFFLLMLPAIADESENDVLPKEYDQGLLRPYASLVYKNMILVTNFGNASYNKQGSGYVSAIQAGVVKTFIRVDGHLKEPRGMAIYDNLLFIADIGRIVVYNLKKITNPPVEIMFSQENLILSDLAIVGNMLIVSVNDSGSIYGIDLKNTKIISQAKPRLLVKVKDANKLLVFDAKLLISSSSIEDKVVEGNVIYAGSLTRSPKSQISSYIENLPPARYFGMALSDKHDFLYFSTLGSKDGKSLPKVFVYTTEGDNKELRSIDVGYELKSPTSLVVKSSNLWIVDHLQNKVFRYSLK